jgi:hypothetical protein
MKSVYPKLIEHDVKIMTVMPERTFWEKATILHHEANRPTTSNIPIRYSRHYYDLFMMINSQYYESSLKKLLLLEKVVNFKMKFYPRGFAKYEDASSGKLRLVPSELRIDELKKDYKMMEEMIFGEVPNFDEIIDTLNEVEVYINRLNKEPVVV